MQNIFYDNKTSNHSSGLLRATLFICLMTLLVGCKAPMGTLSQSSAKKQPAPPELRVAMVAFLPLAIEVRDEEAPHDKVLTGEFHEDEEVLRYADGYFVPHEYQHIINENIRIEAALRSLNLKQYPSLPGIMKGAYDIIILGAVRQARVTNKAQVILDIRLYDGETFAPIRSLTIEKTGDR